MLVQVGENRVDVVDEDCPFRSCFHLGFDKGAFTPGVGYTRYHEGGPRPVCWTRHLSGCPNVGVTNRCWSCNRPVVIGRVCECGTERTYWVADIKHAPEPCCAKPDVAKNPRAWSQRCRSCGTKLTGTRLADVRAKLGHV